MELAIQGAIWLGAGVTLVMLLSRRRRSRGPYANVPGSGGWRTAHRAEAMRQPRLSQCRSNLW